MNDANTRLEEKRLLVAEAHQGLFTRHDFTVLERCFSPAFIEHSPLVANGLDGLRELVQAHPQLRHEAVRVLADGDMVAIHGRFTGLDEKPLVGFDLYRVDEGLIVEHWDALVPEAAPNASGRTQLDGPATWQGMHDVEANREKVRKFFEETLIGGDYQGFVRFTDGKTFLQHSPDIGDGVPAVIAFLEQMAANGQRLVYERIHHMVADGPFVLTHSEGSIDGQRHAYFELWRVEKGRIIELWDAIAPVPPDDQALHRHGIF